jgi:hypothetical protein
LKIGGSAPSPLKTRVPAPFRCTAIRESGPPFDSEVASRRGVVVYTRGLFRIIRFPDQNGLRFGTLDSQSPSLGSSWIRKGPWTGSALGSELGVGGRLSLDQQTRARVVARGLSLPMTRCFSIMRLGFLCLFWSKF